MSSRAVTPPRLPEALISVDLDDAWAYLRARGDPHWEEAPTVLPIATERLLGLFADFGLTVTVFVVGRDARTPRGRSAIEGLMEAGHEISNHSLEHRHDLAHLRPDEIEADLRRSAEEIASVTGVSPRGFRSPSFGVSRSLHRVLFDLNYLYDASLLPTFAGPILRWYHRRSMTARPMSPQAIFGPLSDGLLPIEAFDWEHDDFRILELPVTTVPILRAPMHMSYLHAVGALARPVADAYLRVALTLCRLSGIPVSFLVHPPDVLDADDAAALSYLPGMAVPWEKKVDFLRRSLAQVIEGRSVRTHGEYAGERGGTRTVRWERA